MILNSYDLITFRAPHFGQVTSIFPLCLGTLTILLQLLHRNTLYSPRYCQRIFCRWINPVNALFSCCLSHILFENVRYKIKINNNHSNVKKNPICVMEPRKNKTKYTIHRDRFNSSNPFLPLIKSCNFHINFCHILTASFPVY